ncbi:major facilitator superfamily domain-containing protein, partial [Schizophyllum fasciatum]
RWLFYIEGALTMFFAVLAMIILPDFPATTRGLTDMERRLAIRRMEEDVGVGDEGQTEGSGHAQGLVMALTDWKVWWITIFLTSIVVSLSFNAYFPTLAKTMGYNDTATLLLCAPPWVFAAIVVYLWAKHSDRGNERCFHIVASILVGIVGFIIAIATMNTAARYVSLFLMAQMYAAQVLIFTWISNSFPRPPSKRAVALALPNAFSQLGNVAGSYVWPDPWGPSFRNSYGICIACAGLTILMALVYRFHLASLNKRIEAEEEESGQKTKFRFTL